MSESHKRTIARAVSWRIIATLITAIWAGFNAAIVINVILTMLHYVHERVWLNIKWGNDIQ
jgi:uncharacterized membrane protein